MDSFPWGLYFRVLVDESRRDLAGLPDEWALKVDPNDVGLEEGWHSPELDDRDWMRVRVPLVWEDTAAGAHDGYGWYRVWLTLPAEAEGSEVVLAFGGVDEQAWVYVSGQYLGERTDESTNETVGEF